MIGYILAATVPLYVAVAIGWFHGLVEWQVPAGRAAAVAVLWPLVVIALGLFWVVAMVWQKWEGG